MADRNNIRITYRPTGEIIAEGPKGWGMFPFEGSYYISEKNLKTEGFKFSGIPGLCPYKFIYFWYHFIDKNGNKSSMMGWKYLLPNPIFPFIIFRIAVPAYHPDLLIQEK